MTSGKRSGRVGHIAQGGQVKLRQVHLQQQGEHGWHPGEAGDPLPLHQFQHRCGKGKRPFENQSAAKTKRHQHLIQTVVERKRERVEHDIRLDVSEIRNDRSRGKQDITVIAHHSLRFASRTGSVNETGQIRFGRLTVRRHLGKRLLDGRESHPVSIDTSLGLRALAASDDPFQRRHRTRRQIQPVRNIVASLRQQHRRPAIVQDVLELVLLCGGMDRYEDGTGLQGREHTDHEFDRVLQIDSDAVPATHAELPQGMGAAVGHDIQVSVGKADAIANQRGLVRKPSRALLKNILHQIMIHRTCYIMPGPGRNEHRSVVETVSAPLPNRC